MDREIIFCFFIWIASAIIPAQVFAQNECFNASILKARDIDFVNNPKAQGNKNYQRSLRYVIKTDPPNLRETNPQLHGIIERDLVLGDVSPPIHYGYDNTYPDRIPRTHAKRAQYYFNQSGCDLVLDGYNSVYRIEKGYTKDRIVLTPVTPGKTRYVKIVLDSISPNTYLVTSREAIYVTIPGFPPVWAFVDRSDMISYGDLSKEDLRKATEKAQILLPKDPKDSRDDIEIALTGAFHHPHSHIVGQRGYGVGTPDGFQGTILETKRVINPAPGVFHIDNWGINQDAFAARTPNYAPNPLQ